MIASASNMEFTSYWQLLQGATDGASSLVIGDIQGRLAWASPDMTEGAATTLIEKILTNGCKRLCENKTLAVRKDDREVLAVGIPAADKEIAGVAIAYRHNKSDGQSAPEHSVLKILKTIGTLLGNEISLVNELETVSSELGDRYEELNLLYSTEKDIQQYDDQATAIGHILEKTMLHLDVEAVSLLAPVKHLSLSQIREDSTISQNTVNDLTMELFRKVIEHWRPVIANDEKDSDGGELVNQLNHKCVAIPVYHHNGEVSGVLVAVNRLQHTNFINSDRTMLEIMVQRIHWIISSSADALTGLLTRHAFVKQLDSALAQSRSNLTISALLYVNIDRLHVINDVCGPQAGDLAIQSVARCIEESCGVDGIVARLGGDDFSVLLQNCSTKEATGVAKEIGQQVNGFDFVWNDTSHELSVSIGISQISNTTSNPDAALGAAQIACSDAKEAGGRRSRTMQHDDTVLLMRQDQMKWINRIRSALRNSSFKLFAQRIEPLAESDSSLHHEILIRLEDNDGAIISPNEFIPSAERYNLMPDIDRWVIENVFKILAEARSSENSPADIGLVDNATWAINLSGQSLCDGRLIVYILNRLNHYKLSPHSICFEVTESAAVQNLSEARKIIDSLKSEGFKFSLDDFGTGVSSFSYLSNLPVDYLKIDGCFVRPLLEDLTSEAVVTAIGQIARKIDLKTIAEFVETRELADKLKEIGIDYAQGYAFSRPVPLVSILDALCNNEKAAIA